MIAIRFKQYFSKQSNLLWNNGIFAVEQFEWLIKNSSQSQECTCLCILPNKNLQYNNIIFPERIILSWYLARIRKGRPSFLREPATSLQYIMMEIFAEEKNELYAHIHDVICKLLRAHVYFDWHENHKNKCFPMNLTQQTWIRTLYESNTTQRLCYIKEKWKNEPENWPNQSDKWVFIVADSNDVVTSPLNSTTVLAKRNLIVLC